MGCGVLVLRREGILDNHVCRILMIVCMWVFRPALQFNTVLSIGFVRCCVEMWHVPFDSGGALVASVVNATLQKRHPKP